MQFSLKVILFMACVALFKGCHAYEHKNQALWYDIDGAQCNLERQSPIELNSLDALISYGIPAINLFNYNVNINTEITNNGHTADLKIPKNRRLTLSGGPLGEATYLAESIHFHWGSRNYHGSEHVVDNYRSSLEMHIVHRNSKYNTVAEATNYPDGLSVLGVFYDVDSYQQQDFLGLNKIVNALNGIVNYNTTTTVSNLIVKDLLADISTKNFFTYQGSLTTPPCSQAVTWIVFPQRIHITENQIARFRALLDSQGDALVNNYRHLQAKGSRQVYLSRDNNEVY